jgi:hypothetical protein
MFKKENCAQKQQIIIAWFGIGKLAEVIKTSMLIKIEANLYVVEFCVISLIMKS